MDLVRAWAAGVAVFALSNLAVVWTAAAAEDAQQITRGTGRILWSVVPALVVYLLTALAAALAHPRGTGPVRHAFAVFTVPGVLLAVSDAGALMSGSATPAATAWSTLAALAATLAGRWIAGWIRGHLGRRTGYW